MPDIAAAQQGWAPAAQPEPKASPQGPFPKEATYFSRRFYVAYSPSDWREYLQRLLAADSDTDKAELPFLIRCLLFRSRCHAISLQRVLNDVSLALPPEDPRGYEAQIEFIRTARGNRWELLYQVALEAVMDEPLQSESESLSSICARQPSYLQRVYDALYWPAQLWTDSLDYDDPSFEIAEDGLRARLEQSADAKKGEDTGITTRDVRLLLAAVRNLIWYLRVPSSLVDAVASSFDQPFLDAIRNTESLVDETAKANTFQWLRYPDGVRRYSSVGVDAFRADAQFKQDLALLNSVRRAVRFASSGAVDLEDTLEALKEIASLRNAEEVLNRIDAGVDAPGADDARGIVGSISSAVRSAGAELARRLLAATLLERASGATRFRAAWDELTNWLPLLPGPPTDEPYKELMQALESLTGVKVSLPEASLEEYQFRAWSEVVRTSVTSIREDPFALIGTELIDGSWIGAGLELLADRGVGMSLDDRLKYLAARQVARLRQVGPLAAEARDVRAIPIAAWCRLELLAQDWRADVCRLATSRWAATSPSMPEPLRSRWSVGAAPQRRYLLLYSDKGKAKDWAPIKEAGYRAIEWINRTTPYQEPLNESFDAVLLEVPDANDVPFWQALENGLQTFLDGRSVIERVLGDLNRSWVPSEHVALVASSSDSKSKVPVYDVQAGPPALVWSEAWGERPA